MTCTIYILAPVRRARDSCVIAADKEYIDSIFKSVQLNKVKKMLIIRDLHYGWNCKNIKYIITKVSKNIQI